MIFIFLDFLSINFFAAVIFVGAMITALVLGISFHEFSHAFVADRLGDGLPRRMGRLTLNPLAHLEPVGTMLMLLPPRRDRFRTLSLQRSPGCR